jgi:hypothetical protein
MIGTPWRLGAVAPHPSLSFGALSCALHAALKLSAYIHIRLCDACVAPLRAFYVDAA